MAYRGPVPALPPYAVRSAAALAAGAALWAAFPQLNLWWLAPVGVALLAAAVWESGWWRGLVFGLLGGWAFFIPTLSWSGIYVGVLPWMALATLQACYFAVMGGLLGWGTRRWNERGGWGRFTAYGLVPLAWVTQEFARARTPWGGFPWARLAFSQSEGPLLPYAALGGAPLVGAAVATLGTALLACVHAWRRPGGRRRLVVVTAVAGVLGILVSAARLIPVPTDGRTVAIGYVQGNVPHAGLDFNAERRAVLDNHVGGTEALAASLPPDATLVVWPENASDIDPLRNSDAAAQIERAVDAVGVPVLVGAVLVEPPGHNSNVSLLYRPGGGEPERYTKLHPVPFAEYIPYRQFFAWFSEAALLAGDFVAGDEIGAFAVDSRDGRYWALPSICFEVAYDDLIRNSTRAAAAGDGGEESVLVVQTNNATFGFSAESEQQFAISRLRAVEHGRSVVHVSTVGVSGFIAPDGSVRHLSALFEPRTATDDVVVRSGLTVSDRLGPWPERAAALAFGVLVLRAGLGRRRG